MAKTKLPQRADDKTRLENAWQSDLVQIASRNGDFRNNYGPWLGALLYWLSIKAARPSTIWWKGLIAVSVGLIGWLVKP